MSITPLPPVPQRGDDPQTFSSRADAFLAAFPQLQSEVNDVVVQINEDRDDIAQMRADATAQALLAQQAAEYAGSRTGFRGAWSGLSGSLEPPAIVTHLGAAWRLNASLANVALSEPAPGNPDWSLVLPDSDPVEVGFTYDAAGRITDLVETLPGGVLTRDTSFTYDSHGRVATSVAVFGSVTLTTAYAYNSAGQLTGLTITES